MKKAINWNELNKDLYKTFWDQNVRQFWVDEEIPVSEDLQDWNSDKLSVEEKDVYEKVLAGLTLLDTVQANEGMNNISMKIEDLHAKAVLSFMGMMEQMHAKSYSTIFSTLASSQRIDELFQWIEKNDLLQNKIDKISKLYNEIKTEEDLYLSLSASVLLETFLFYSGFFYPLYLAGQGMLIHSGEIISLIIRDESVHGLFVGLLAQEELKKIEKPKQEQLKKKIYQLVDELYEIETEYTKYLYEKINLDQEVLKYVEYNCDKALMNLGLDTKFNIQEEEINSVVLNGLDTTTKQHDFFSTKGNGYIKTTNVEAITDDTFEY